MHFSSEPKCLYESWFQCFLSLFWLKHSIAPVTWRHNSKLVLLIAIHLSWRLHCNFLGWWVSYTKYTRVVYVRGSEATAFGWWRLISVTQSSTAIQCSGYATNRLVRPLQPSLRHCCHVLLLSCTEVDARTEALAEDIRRVLAAGGCYACIVTNQRDNT